MKKIYLFIIKTLICLIIFLSLAIISKKNINYKEKIKKELYENQLSFTQFKNLYHKYLGGIIPLEKILKTKTVFNEKITYKNQTPYLNGVSLEVEDYYIVPNQEAGLVTFIGEKEEYGNTIIIEDKNNISHWYGNICNTSIKLYDYIEKGSYLGEACNQTLYLAYEKNNQFLPYKDYLK